MKFRLEATPGELYEKGDALVEELAKAFSGINPDLAEALEKALPPREQELKHLVLQGLKARTDKEYAAMLKRMLKDVGEVLDQSVTSASMLIKGGTGLPPPEPPEPEEDAEPEEPLEPGDYDPKADEIVPEPEEPEEEEEKSLEKAGPFIGPRGGEWADSKHKIPWHGGDKTKQMKSKLEASRARTAAAKKKLEEVKGRVEAKKTELTETLESTTASSPEKARAEELKAKIKKVEAATKKVEQKLAQEDRKMDKSESLQSEPLEHDHTKLIAEKDGRAYGRVKSALQKKGWKPADFEAGGTLYGYSVNQLIELSRGKAS